MPWWMAALLEWLLPHKPLALHPLNEMPSVREYHTRMTRQGVNLQNTHQIIELGRVTRHEPDTFRYAHAYNLHIRECKFCNPDSIHAGTQKCVVGRALKNNMTNYSRSRRKQA